MTTTTTTTPSAVEPPAAVRGAFLLWMTAVTAGAFETALAVSGMAYTPALAAGLAVRLTVFTAAVLVALRMRRGHRWARTTLALVLGVAGTASMVAEPIHNLAQGASISTALGTAGPMELLFATSRTLHTAAVLSAVALMFLPTANTYFAHATGAAGLAAERTTTWARRMADALPGPATATAGSALRAAAPDHGRGGG